MNRWYSFIIVLGLCASLGACSEDSVFDDPSYERMEELFKKCDDILKSSEGGWRLKYFPDPSRVGGYNVVMKFDENNQVSMICDYQGESKTSTYKLYGGQGPVLSFDTYSLLHVLGDPKYTPIGHGFQGDHELIIQKVTTDSIVCVGRKWKRPMVLVRADTEAWSRMDDVKQMEFVLAPVQENAPFFRNVRQDGEGIVTFLYEPTTRSLEYFYNDENGKVQSGLVGVVFSEDGFSLYETITVRGVSLKDFKYDKTANEFVFGKGGRLTMDHYSAVVFKGAWDSFFQADMAGMYRSSRDFLQLVDEARGFAPEIATFQFYWNMSGYKLFSIVMMDSRGMPRWYHSQMKNIENPGEDHVIFEAQQEPGTGKYFVAQPSEEYMEEWSYLFDEENEASAKMKEMLDIVYTPEGFTIIPASDGSYYMISRERSSYWFQVRMY